MWKYELSGRAGSFGPVAPTVGPWERKVRYTYGERMTDWCPPFYRAPLQQLVWRNSLPHLSIVPLIGCHQCHRIVPMPCSCEAFERVQKPTALIPIWREGHARNRK